VKLIDGKGVAAGSVGSAFVGAVVDGLDGVVAVMVEPDVSDVPVSAVVEGVEPQAASPRPRSATARMRFTKASVLPKFLSS
jgi:hypothetical protein